MGYERDLCWTFLSEILFSNMVIPHVLDIHAYDEVDLPPAGSGDHCQIGWTRPTDKRLDHITRHTWPRSTGGPRGWREKTRTTTRSAKHARSIALRVYLLSLWLGGCEKKMSWSGVLNIPACAGDCPG
jgi:hypothetical protein